MSIFDNKDLLDSFYKITLRNAEIIKKAQGVEKDVSVNKEYVNYLSLSRKLVDNLESSLNNTNTSVSISSPEDVDMNIYDLNSLGNFFQFLSSNKIEVNGKRIVYANTEMPPNKEWVITDAERSVPAETGDRQALTGQFYVNKTLLNIYIRELSKRIGKQDPDMQKMLIVLLGDVAKQSNEVLGTNYNISKQVEEVKSQEAGAVFDYVITSFPKLLSMSNPIADGPIPLRAADVGSADNFINWTKGSNVSVVSQLDPSNPSRADESDFDICIAVQVVYNKLNYMQKSYANDPNSLSRIQNALNSFKVAINNITGPNGAVCQISSVNIPLQNNQQSNQQGGQAGNQQSNSQQSNMSGENLVQLLNSALNNLPFSPEDINFDRIDLFFSKVKPLFESSPKGSQAMGAIAMAEASMKNFTSLTQNGVTEFSLGMRIGDYALMFDRRQADRLIPKSFYELNRALSATNQVVNILRSQYGDKMGNGIHKIDQQIGRSSTEYSYYRRNINDLELLRKSFMSNRS